MHLLPDSRSLGCATVGAHIHVRHRANANGALAKSRFPRSVPASDAVLAGYADYQHERAGLAGDDGTDLVLVADAFYEKDLAGQVLRFMERSRARGAAVLAGDFGRTYLPRACLAPLASYDVPGLLAMEGSETKRTTVWTLR